jgi:hypothetical protein
MARAGKLKSKWSLPLPYDRAVLVRSTLTAHDALGPAITPLAFRYTGRWARKASRPLPPWPCRGCAPKAGLAVRDALSASAVRAMSAQIPVTRSRRATHITLAILIRLSRLNRFILVLIGGS